MNHDAVSTSRNVSKVTSYGIRNMLSRFDLGREVLYGVLRLNGVCAEQRVLLQSDFIFYDDCGYAKTFKCTYCKYEMFLFTTSVTIVNKWFCGHFKRIVKSVQTGCQVYRLYVGVSFRC